MFFLFNGKIYYIYSRGVDVVKWIKVVDCEFIMCGFNFCCLFKLFFFFFLC